METITKTKNKKPLINDNIVIPITPFSLKNETLDSKKI